MVITQYLPRLFPNNLRYFSEEFGVLTLVPVFLLVEFGVLAALVVAFKAEEADAFTGVTILLTALTGLALAALVQVESRI